MKKLIISLAVALCMSLSYMTANAAIEVTGWEKSTCAIPSGKEAGIEYLQAGEDPAPDGGLGMLHLWTGGPTGTANLNANAIQSISNLEITKKYRLTANVKFSSNDTLMNIQNAVINGVSGTSYNFVNNLGQENRNKWIDFSLDFQPTNPTIEIRFTVMANREMWLDNISVREIIYEEDGVTEAGFGEELVINGDFEADLDFVAPEDVKNVHVENMDGSAKISWTNPEEDFFTAYVYSQDDPEFSISTDEGYILLDNLENGVEYTYIIKTSDKAKNFSNGVTVLVKPVADDLKVSDVRFEINGEPASEIYNGLLKTSVDIKNNGCADDFQAELIVVLLKDGALVDINTAYSMIKRTDWRGDPTTLQTEITVPEGDGYSVAVYIWSSLGEMESIVDRRISL